MTQVLLVYSLGRHALPSWWESTPVDVLDARVLVNPYKLPEFRDLTGLDAATREFVLAQPKAEVLLGQAEALLVGRLGDPRHPVLRVGFRCTGGKDRSVALAGELAARALTWPGDLEVVLRHLHVHLRGGADRRGYESNAVGAG